MCVTMPSAHISITKKRRGLYYERFVFWVLMPLSVAIVSALTTPDATAKVRVLVVIYAFGVVAFSWGIIHVITHLLARFLVPKSWRDVQASVLPGFVVLCIGSLIGNALMFPIRQFRADLYCQLAQQFEAACYALQPINGIWDMAGDFSRTTLLNMVYWLVANYIVASLFNVRRYGFRISQIRVSSQHSPAAVDVDTSPLLSRIPFELGDDVISLSANQHYLDVHTRKGTALVLYRLSDAVKELGDRGVQIHRSYWVAYDAIRAIKRDGSALFVILDNGTTLPVSRGNRHLLKTGRFRRMQIS